MLRSILVGIFALLTAATVVRVAAVEALAEQPSTFVASVWANHPQVLRSVAMGEVGRAAAAGQEPGAPTLDRLRRLAVAEPLATEPLLVAGAIAQRQGDAARAENLLLQARNRDPRSAAARFLLADLYLRTGKILPGLGEMSVLGRLVPGALAQVAPALAAYAASPNAAPRLKSILRSYPELEQPILSELAKDVANTDLILAIAPSEDLGAAWQQQLLANLVGEGEYARAFAVWARLTGLPPDKTRGLFNPGFQRSDAPPPFNWVFASTGFAVAEPMDGQLSVLYFGRDDVTLASQLMLLSSGNYRLGMTVEGKVGGGSEIRWIVSCAAGGRELVELPLGGRSGKWSIATRFDVPGDGCDVQRIELKATAQELREPIDFRIADLSLTRIG